MNTTSTSQNEQEYLDLPDFKDILDPLSFVVEESGVAPTKRELGRSYYKLAKIHYDKSDLGRARHYFERALALCELPRDVFAILKVQGFLIRIFSEALEQNSAMEMIQKCEKTVEELTQILGSLNSEYFYNVGLVKNYRGEFAQARENFELAYKKSREENEPDLQAKSLLALANSCFSSKDYEQALKYLDLLENLLAIIDKSYLQGSMFLTKGRIYLEHGQFDLALISFDKAMEKLQEKKSWNLYGYVLMGRGVAYKRQGEYDKAMTYFQFAKECMDVTTFKRLDLLLRREIEDVNDSSIDLYLDRINRKVIERQIGSIDFKHRFVLLEILFLLAKNCGRYYDKDQLAKEIWKDEYNPLIHDKLIYTSVSRLRKLIEPKNGKGDKRKYIIRGKDGYTFNPRVRLRFHSESQLQGDQGIANIDLNSPV